MAVETEDVSPVMVALYKTLSKYVDFKFTPEVGHQIRNDVFVCLREHVSDIDHLDEIMTHVLFLPNGTRLIIADERDFEVEYLDKHYSGWRKLNGR